MDDFQPITRVETYLAALSGEDVTPPEPTTRIEEWLDKVVDNVDNVQTEKVTTAVDAWLSDHIDPETGYVLDDTLTLDNAAAPAGTVGEELDEVKSAITQIVEPRKNLFDKNNINSLDGYINATTITSNANAKTIYVPCEANTDYTVSKSSVTARFAVAYSSTEPTVGGTIGGTIAKNNDKSITITTDASAKYLVVWVYLSTADTLTYQQLCAMLQIEKGSTATAYEPFEYTAIDSTARSDIEKLETYPVIQSESTDITLGSELIADFSSLTAIGSATYSDGNWTMPSNSGVSTTLNVTAWKMYLIDIGLVSSVVTDGSSMYKVNPLTITLGNASIDIFANTDGNWKVGLTPSASGSVTFSMVCSSALELTINSLSVKQVTKHADITMMVNQNLIIMSQFGTSKNFAVGNGLKTNATGDSNVAVGYNAQAYMATGNRNTAIGAYAQNKTKTGTANVAIGDNTQVEMESGMFNVAIGTATQRYLTYGAWNVGIGNEVQRNSTVACNNVGIGRRAQSYLTTGGMNTAIGALAGFGTVGHQTGDWATTTSNYQTLIGGESTQATTGTADYLTTLGYRAKGIEKAIAIGANASATGEQSIAIGYGAEATHDNEIVIGGDGDSIILCGKKIVFNQDGTVTWEAVT